MEGPPVKGRAGSGSGVGATGRGVCVLWAGGVAPVSDVVVDARSDCYARVVYLHDRVFVGYGPRV
jgi:hypothetical protein